ncbi:DUF58 domain-containing protein [Zavarzinia sp. CC-PAN008]|uniref:DUF58 domain-containing protein n=1 Tax=Zavarzinia sp. CC-PAN008 TaxID=3243332 RepID=UPI003F747770
MARFQARPAAGTDLSLALSAEQAGGRLPPLLVAAERVAATVAQGVHGRRRVGMGETFWQYRRYQPGDSVARIDWRQSAKAQPLFVRETEWEAAQSVWLWCDPSPSMDWRSGANLPTKRERALLLALALASLLVRAGERVGELGRDRLPRSGRAAFNRLAFSLLTAPPVPGGDGLPPREVLPRHAGLLVASDFLTPLDELDAAIRFHATRQVRGHLLHIVDPAEAALPYQGRARFVGLEGEPAYLATRVESVRAAYFERVAQHHDALKALARAAGWTFSAHHTDKPPETALLALHAALSGAASMTSGRA